MSELLSRIKESTGFRALYCADDVQLREAQNTLGLRFANEYLDYVKAFGVATFDGHELTGVCKGDRLNVVSATTRARNNYANLPKDQYVVEELNFDGIIITQNNKGTIYSYGPDDRTEKVANSLSDYLFFDNG